MKILQICSAATIGGGERHVSDLANALARRGHDVFAATRPGSPLISLMSEVRPENLFAAELRNAADVISASRISGFAGRVGADVIHAHLARDYPIAALASRLCGVPFVLTRHVLFPMKRLQKFVLRGVSAVIAPSSAVYDVLLAEGIVPAGKVTLIHHGVDTDHFAPFPRSHREVETVGTIGQFTPLKGYDTLISAAAIVSQHMPDIRFLFSGNDDTHCRGRRSIEKAIAGAALEGRVEFAPRIDDARTILCKMDIFVSASRSESFGLAIAEAMSSGIPVIATMTAGACEIIEQGESGVLVPMDDGAAIASSIMSLANHRDIRERLAAAGRRRIIDRFSLEQMVSKTETVYINTALARTSDTIATR